MPEVSVLIPCYNAGQSLEGSVSSVLAQTLRDWELILVDDGSTDDTAQIMRRLSQKDSRIRSLFCARNAGAAAARNRALEAATGQYIAFLDADDLWRVDKLSLQIAEMRAQSAVLSCTGYSRVTPEGRLIERVQPPLKQRYHDLLKSNDMGCLTVMYDSAHFGKCPMPDLPRQEDYALWLQLLKHCEATLGIETDLAVYRVGRNTLSSNKLGAARNNWQLLRSHEALPLHKAAYYFAHYAQRGLRKRLIERPSQDAVQVIGLDGQPI